MSRTSHLTSISQLSLEEKGLKKSTQGKGIQFHECEGFGQVRDECPAYLKKQKKNLSVTRSDEDSESDLEESTKYVKALTGKYVFDEESSDVN